MDLFSLHNISGASMTEKMILKDAIKSVFDAERKKKVYKALLIVLIAINLIWLLLRGKNGKTLAKSLLELRR